MRWEWAYLPDEKCAAAAREKAAAALGAVGVAGGIFDDVQIVLVELVTNAIRHAATEFTVTLEVDDTAIRVGVLDGGRRPPALLVVGQEAPSGRGLQIVSALAAAWGYERTGRDGTSGKAVWAQFER